MNTDHTLNERSEAGENALLSTVLLFGGLWGVAEATLGYALHLASRFLPFSGLPGFLMYPVAFFFMFAAVRVSGSPAAAFLTAVVAASVKASSLALPGVTLLFVGNPVLAILSEGLVSFAGFSIFSLKKDWTLLPKAALLALCWRGLFLLAVFLLPVQKGILMKGSSAILSFVFVESAVNALVIGLMLLPLSRGERTENGGYRFLHPLPAGAVVTAALIIQLGIAALP